MYMAPNLHFEKLTLNDNVNIDVYEEAFNFAFSSPDIKNIAISGAYGAGKSSVLASYKKKHSEKSFIHISLAHFQEEQTSNSSDEKNESVLEGKILNQLIHQLSPNDIPQTNFKIKQNVDKKQIKNITAFTVLAFLCSLFILKHNVWCTFADKFSGWFGNLLSVTKSPYALLFAGIILTILCTIFIYNVIKMQKLKKFLKRITFQGNEIEIFENDDESFFDKYLNEVLYLFENSNVDAIVFEDMDRFEMNRIFERLREVNTLVNGQLEKREDKKVLRFLYLLRDDVFISKDRTKFFDYIVPIVPVLDATNSYDQFILHLKKNNVYSKLDGKFLQGLSLYVDDMRLLKNICNEFLIYYNRVNTTELDYNKMFALITYKNLFPRDFSDLQLGRGFVFSLFSQKKVFVAAEEERLKKLISDKTEEIKYCKNEELQTLDELETIRKQKQSSYNNLYGGARSAEQRKYNEWYENEYPKRKQAIENKIANRIESLNFQLEYLDTEYNKLQISTLKDIITRENIDSIFKTNSTNEIGETREYKEIKGNEYFPLLKYLIRNGYIDESYADYMTYFYENSVSKIDKIFLRSVADKKAKPSSYELKDPKLVVSRLDVLDFEEKETLNFNLLKYLFEEMADSKQLKTVISQLSKESNLEFMRQFFNYTHNWSNYVAVLNKLWPSFFKEMLEADIFPRKIIYDFSMYSLYFSSLEDVSNINIDNCLTDFITNASDYLYISKPDIDKLIKGFKHLGVCFKTINYEASDKELFRAVYENSLYNLNFDNIELMLTVMESLTNKDEIIHSNFSLVSTNPKSPLYKYVQCNIEKYISLVLDNCQERIADNTDVLLFIINSEDISDEHKREYIEYLITVIDDISLIDDTSLWGHCLKSDIIKFSENNIYLYYHNIKSFDSNLIYYINKFENNINMKKVDIDDEEASSLFTTCLKCSEIDNTKYRQILSSMNRVYKQDFTIKDLPNDKMKILIEEEIIKFTSKSLMSLRENYEDVCFYFIEKNFNSYIENMTADLFSFDELLVILEWNVEDTYKFSLLSFTSKPISILDINCSIEVKLYILQHNLNSSDIPVLRTNYHTQDAQIKKYLVAEAISNIANVIKNAQGISYSLIKDLFSSDVLDKNNKLSLLTERIPLLSRIDCLQAFNTIGRTDFASIFETRKHPKFSVCKANQTVLDKLQAKGWIYDYYIDENDSNYYRIRRTKPSKRIKQD